MCLLQRNLLKSGSVGFEGKATRFRVLSCCQPEILELDICLKGRRNYKRLRVTIVLYGYMVE